MVITSKEIVVPVGSDITLTITGTGKQYASYVVIDGTTYIDAVSELTVVPGDIIAFTAYGSMANGDGYVSIDGEVVLTAGWRGATYEWVVPDGIKKIVIEFTQASEPAKITVTTS